jgi:U4/U6 small nuclear ribonucleoprotein PRP3
MPHSYRTLAYASRLQAQLEELKQRIADSAKKAGLDSEFEVAEKNVRVSFLYPTSWIDTLTLLFPQREAPPAAEWWDAALLPNKTYDDLVLGVSALNIRNPDSPINLYVQHPIPIPAPGDKNKITFKPLMLTKKVCFFCLISFQRLRTHRGRL